MQFASHTIYTPYFSLVSKYLKKSAQIFFYVNYLWYIYPVNVANDS